MSLEDQPEWVETDRVAVVLHDDELDPDVMPINPLLHAAKDLGDGEILELVTSHLPHPESTISAARATRLGLSKMTR